MSFSMWFIYIICLINQSRYLEKDISYLNTAAFMGWTFGGFFTVATWFVFSG